MRPALRFIFILLLFICICNILYIDFCKLTWNENRDSLMYGTTILAFISAFFILILHKPKDDTKDI
jgi:hypothetical protein